MNPRHRAATLGAALAAVLTAAASAQTLIPVPPGPQAASPPTRDKPVPPKATATIKGSVVDAQTGAPIRGAIVNAFSSATSASMTALSDAEGRYEVTLPAGAYRLQASRTGFLTTAYGQRRPQTPAAQVTVGEMQTVEKVVIAMARGGVIAGRVFDEFGEPVAAAEVRALQYRFEGGGRRLLPVYGPGGSVRTDDLGGFRIYGLQPGQFYVSARPPNENQGYGGPALRPPDGPTTTFFPAALDPAGAQRLIVAAARETGPIVLTLATARLATIRGRALTSSGEPFAPGFVQLMLRDPSGDFGGGGGGTVRPDGSFEITRVAPGTYELRVNPMQPRREEDAEVGRTIVSVAGENIDDVLIVGAKPGMALGRFVADDGTPLPFKASTINISANAASFDDRMGGYTQGRMNEDLSFEIRGLYGIRHLRPNLFAGGDPGGWQLKAVLWNGDDVTDIGIEFPPNRLVEGIDVVLTRATTELRGIVNNHRGEAAADTWLVVFPADEARWTWQSRYVRATRTGPDGTYRLRGLPPHADYLVAAVLDMEQSQWQDPDFLRVLAERATRLSLAEGETKVHNLKVARAAQ